MTEDIFRRLQERLDQYSMGFPATDSGVEIDILKELFSEDDAELFLHLTPQPETPEEVARRIDRPLEPVAAHLDDMSERGLLFRLRKGDRVKYGAIPFVHGLFEFQVSTLKPRLAGLVTQPATAQNPGGMCNCCGDCCGVLTSLKRYPRPAEKVFSNYFATVDPDLCIGCVTCLDRCQMDAIGMNEDGAAEIDRDRCIGCGLCVVVCPEGALKLVPKPEAERRTPPATGFEQMAFMAETRRAA